LQVIKSLQDRIFFAPVFLIIRDKPSGMPRATGDGHLENVPFGQEQWHCSDPQSNRPSVHNYWGSLREPAITKRRNEWRCRKKSFTQFAMGYSPVPKPTLSRILLSALDIKPSTESVSDQLCGSFRTPSYGNPPCISEKRSPTRPNRQKMCKHSESQLCNSMWKRDFPPR
jgi:hypothetical protein